MKTDRPSARVHRASTGLQAISALLAVGGLLLAGCASSTEVKIDSLAKPKAENAVSYQIHNTNPLIEEDSLRFKEAAAMVRTALSAKGMYEAPEGTKADFVVDLDYGVGPPERKQETYTEPVYAYVPGPISYQTVVVGVDKQGQPVVSTVAVQGPPTMEVTGYRERVVMITVYEKYLRLSARENKPAEEGRPPAEIWTLDATSEGESHDVRKNLPMLVAASIDYIGQDTHGQKTIHIKDGSPDVGFIKKGL